MTSIVNLVKNGLGVAVIPKHAIKRSDGLIIHELPGGRKSTILTGSFWVDDSEIV